MRTATVLFSVMWSLLACDDGGEDPREDGGTEEDGGHASDDAGVADAGHEEPIEPAIHFFVDPFPHRDDGEIESDIARYGDPIHVVVEGLPPGETALLEFVGGAGVSWAEFVVRENGTVDLATDTPTAGTWSTANADGFLSTMANPPGGALDLSIRAIVTVGPTLSLEKTITRRYVNQDLVVENVAFGTVRGVYARPPGDGPFGAILCFGGSEGGTGTGSFCATYWASLGYAVLGVGYFGAAGLPNDLTLVPLEILEQDIGYLLDQPDVAGDGVVVMGGSRGGELALLLASTFPSVVVGAVGQVPSGYVFGSVDGTDEAAWTVDGAPLAYIPSSGGTPPYIRGADGDYGYAFGPLFVDDIEAASEAERAAASIPVENASGPILLLAGDDDQLWPGCVLADVAWERLLSTGHHDLHDDEYLCVDGAGHASVGVPGWSTVGTSISDAFGYPMLLGGTAEKNGIGTRESDTRTRAFMERVLGQGRIDLDWMPASGAP